MNNKPKLTLPELTAADITAMLSQTKRKPKKYGLYFDENNRLATFANPSKDQIGSFTGKTGSMRRSRKGRTYRDSNGKRFYLGVDTIPAYKA